jgi:ribosome-binding factor A
MSSRRAERVSESVREALAELILREVKDPRVVSVTITAVRVTNDLARAHVRFRCLGDEAAQVRCLAGLQSATGFLRAQLLRRLQLRRAPQLSFEVDSSLPELERLAQAMHRAGERKE